jgi:hypothetical protein
VRARTFIAPVVVGAAPALGATRSRTHVALRRRRDRAHAVVLDDGHVVVAVRVGQRDATSASVPDTGWMRTTALRCS